MKKQKLKILFLFALSLFFIASCSAVPLVPSNSSLSISVIKGEVKPLILNITNLNTYKLIDIEIVGDYVTSTKIDLESNQTKEITLNILVPITGSSVKTLIISGFSEVSCSSLGTTTDVINITVAGASPRNREICKNSNINFVNNYGNSIRVVIANLSIDQLVDRNLSYTQNFANLGNYVYRIEPLIDVGSINVVDTAQKVHSISDDGSLQLTITSTLVETALTVEMSKTNFTLDHNSISSAFFIIKNTGTTTAENIKFFADWISFDKNNFNLNSDEERAINFVISPTITSADQTNKTYTKQIIITSSNTVEQRHNLTIFIKASDVIGGNISSPQWWIERKKFCDAFPTAPDCLTEPNIIYRDREVFDCPAVLANVSPRDLQQALQECHNLRGDFGDFSNGLKLDVSSLKDSELGSQQSDQMLNNSVSGVDKSVNILANRIYFVVSIIFLSALGGIVSILVFRFYKYKKNLAEMSLGGEQ